MIFVSHNHKDKAVVEQLALRLRDTFGQDNVFYDSWSIQPGDGIIGKMDAALAECRLFLFFVSTHSLASKMVELEWQNAIVQATAGKTRIIPVRLDNSTLPALMQQTLHIDLFSHGLEAALRQIVDVAQGNNTFQASESFSNLRATILRQGRVIRVEIRAIHFMEPVSSYAVFVEGDPNDMELRLEHAQLWESWEVEGDLPSGGRVKGLVVSTPAATVPGYPFVILIAAAPGKTVDLHSIAHRQPGDIYRVIPVDVPPPAYVRPPVP